MKTLGIVGGIGPESTIEYYRFILDGYRARVSDGSAPHLLIDSLDVNRGIAMLDANDLASLTNYISASVERLAEAVSRGYARGDVRRLRSGKEPG